MAFSGKMLLASMDHIKHCITDSYASRLGIFNKIFTALVEKNGSTERLMIDATHFKAHRTAVSLLKKGLFPAVSDVQKAG